MQAQFPPRQLMAEEKDSLRAVWPPIGAECLSRAVKEEAEVSLLSLPPGWVEQLSMPCGGPRACFLGKGVLAAGLEIRVLLDTVCKQGTSSLPPSL